MRQRIFVGSSTEAIGICRAVQSELDDEFEVTVWKQDVFALSRNALDSLLDALDFSDAGIFVLCPDDLVTKREQTRPGVRDNVLFELGMFLGRLGPDRTFMLTEQGADVELPSDLLGLTTAVYDGRAVDTRTPVAVAPACTQIRNQLHGSQPPVAEAPKARARLDRAMARMSRDLESLLGTAHVTDGDENGAPEPVSLRIGNVEVEIVTGRIEDFASKDARSVVALPANEYFDVECLSDVHSSLGAFVKRHVTGRDFDELVAKIDKQLDGLPSERVPRAARRIEQSYGIGQALVIPPTGSAGHMILVSATTERTGIGLRAEPHFLYAVIEGIVEAMNENRVRNLTVPMLGAGHGGMPLAPALLFNLLALRSILDDVNTGRQVRRVRFVLFEDDARNVSDDAIREVISRVVPGARAVR
jgi:O-acetyl-ADP-ribose deacetylase (regulator of RNase III)